MGCCQPGTAEAEMGDEIARMRAHQARAPQWPAAESANSGGNGALGQIMSFTSYHTHLCPIITWHYVRLYYNYFNYHFNYDICYVVYL